MNHEEKLAAFESHVQKLNSKFRKKTSSLKGIFDIVEKQLADNDVKFLKPSAVMELVQGSKPTGDEKYERYKPAIQELCRVWNGKADYDAKHAEHMQKQDAGRLTTLKGKPHEFSQTGHGCCGPAGVLMALLQHDVAEFDALYNCIIGSERYRNVPKSEAVALRLQKRIDDGLLDATKANYLDVRMSVGLIILLKEHLATKGAVFKECLEYSKLWDTWEAGQPVGQGFAQKFSYKHGDIGLTEDATTELLKLVGFKTPQTHELITNDRLVAAKAKKLPTAIPADAELGQSLIDLVTAINTAQTGALMAVAKQLFIGDAKVEPYNYIAHWVYVPKQAVPSTPKDSMKIKTWTWGGELTVQGLLKKDAVYVPRLAIVFNK